MDIPIYISNNQELYVFYYHLTLNQDVPFWHQDLSGLKNKRVILKKKTKLR